MLCWSYKEPIGEAVLVQKFKTGDNTIEEKQFVLKLYQGNAFLIMTHEWEEDGKEKSEMIGFFLDEYHAKNCLGLNKKEGHTENIYESNWQYLSRVRINKKKYKYTDKLVSLLSKAFNNITIEVVSE